MEYGGRTSQNILPTSNKKKHVTYALDSTKYFAFFNLSQV